MKEHASEPETESSEEFRWRLVRRLADINEGWRVCEQRVCRRARRCAVASAPCVEQLLILCTKLSSAPEPEMIADLYKRLMAGALQEREENTDG